MNIISDNDSSNNKSIITCIYVGNPNGHTAGTTVNA